MMVLLKRNQYLLNYSSKNLLLLTKASAFPLSFSPTNGVFLDFEIISFFSNSHLISGSNIVRFAVFPSSILLFSMPKIFLGLFEILSMI